MLTGLGASTRAHAVAIAFRGDLWREEPRDEG
jgi:hypothetical protein